MRDYDLVLARNITRAQRMAQVLREAGMACSWRRAPAQLGEKGCAYALEVPVGRTEEALALWRRAGFGFLRVWRWSERGWEEVRS